MGQFLAKALNGGQFRCWKVKKVCGIEAFATHGSVVSINWENCCEGLSVGLQIPSEPTLT